MVLPPPDGPTRATISPRRGLQGQVVQHRRLVAVGEGDVLQPHGRLAGRQRRGAAARRGSRGSMSSVANSRRAAVRPSAITVCRLATWRSDWPRHQQRRDEGGERARRHLVDHERPEVGRAELEAPAGVGDHQRQHDHGHHLGDRRGHGPGVGAGDDVLLAPGDGGADPRLLERLLVLHLHHPHAVEAFHDAVVSGELSSMAPGGLGGALGVVAQHPGDDRRDHQHDHGQRPVRAQSITASTPTSVRPFCT